MKLRRLNPPLHLLRAFSTVVRFGSVSKAGEALSLGQSAISKQIQDLEKWIEVELFVRSGKKLILTPAGARYEGVIRPLMNQIESATLALISESVDGGVLQISTMPTFGAKWLIPRLPAFQHLHPEIKLNFVSYVRGFDYKTLKIDGSILFGDGRWPGAQSVYLDGRDVVLIAPAMSGFQIDSAHDVARFPLLRHLVVSESWLRWQDVNQVPSLDPLSGPQFDNYQSMIQAVISGIGVALVPRCLVSDEIANKQVVTPLADEAGGGYLSDLGYWFCCDERRPPSAALICFRDWLVNQTEL